MPLGLLEEQPRWVCPVFTGFFCGPELLGQMLFNYNAEQGQLEAIPRDSSGNREPIPKFPDTSEL